jgi:hypothetical protein
VPQKCPLLGTEILGAGQFSGLGPVMSALFPSPFMTALADTQLVAEGDPVGGDGPLSRQQAHPSRADGVVGGIFDGILGVG